jgi:3',5'-cyclic-AMP phosphodiesterase
MSGPERKQKMPRRRVWVAGLATPVLMAMFLVFARSSITANTQQSATATAEVTIDNFTFRPQMLTVAVGTTVTWTNRDDIPHTVVSDNAVFKSKARDTDENFSYTFDKAGTYSYHCSIHPKMTGQVVVH